MVTDNRTNCVYFSALLKQGKLSHPDIFRNIATELEKRGIEYHLLEDTRDIWCRDYMPVQIERDAFIGFDYDPDYLQGSYEHLKTKQADVVKTLNISAPDCGYVIDGGNVVKCGKDILMTVKAVEEINRIRKEKNLGDPLEKDEVQRLLTQCFGYNVILLPWEKKGGDVFGHTDGLVRYVCPGEVVITYLADKPGEHTEKQYLESVEKELVRHGYKVHKLDFSGFADNRKYMASWAYVNFLQTEKVILVPGLNNEELDAEAMVQIRRIFHEYRPEDIVQIQLTSIIGKGGALNCISWNIAR